MDLRHPERIERPAVLEMSFEEFIDWDHEGGLAEWVDGKVYLYVSNTDIHQRVVEFLHIFLDGFIRVATSGAVKLAPYAIRATAGGPGREPDITIVLDRSRVGSSHLEGPPDLIVEVMSEESITRDMYTKFDEYEAAGVREYWVIDPIGARTRLLLRSGAGSSRSPGSCLPRAISRGRRRLSVERARRLLDQRPVALHGQREPIQEAGRGGRPGAHGRAALLAATATGTGALRSIP